MTSRAFLWENLMWVEWSVLFKNYRSWKLRDGNKIPISTSKVFLQYLLFIATEFLIWKFTFHSGAKPVHNPQGPAPQIYRIQENNSHAFESTSQVSSIWRRHVRCFSFSLYGYIIEMYSVSQKTAIISHQLPLFHLGAFTFSPLVSDIDSLPSYFYSLQLLTNRFDCWFWLK
jgi:uncharacterized protein with PQ loop repeat